MILSCKTITLEAGKKCIIYLKEDGVWGASIVGSFHMGGFHRGECLPRLRRCGQLL